MSKEVKSPFEVVASVLEAPVESVTIDSGYGIDGSWDSLRQLSIIGALESEYDISIPDSEIEKYSNMKAIVELFESLKFGI